MLSVAHGRGKLGIAGGCRKSDGVPIRHGPLYDFSGDKQALRPLGARGAFRCRRDTGKPSGEGWWIDAIDLIVASSKARWVVENQPITRPLSVALMFLPERTTGLCCTAGTSTRNRGTPAAGSRRCH